MAQKTLSKAIGFVIGFTVIYFFSTVIDQIRLNIPRYPSYSCLIERPNPGYVAPAVIYVLGKIDWAERKYSIDDRSNLEISFYYSWSKNWTKIDCEKKNE